MRQLVERCAELAELMKIDISQLLQLDSMHQAASEVKAMLVAAQEQAALLVAELKKEAVRVHTLTSRRPIKRYSECVAKAERQGFASEAH